MCEREREREMERKREIEIQGRDAHPKYLLHQFRIDCDLRRCKGRCLNEFQVSLTSDFPRQPQEGLFEVIVALCTDIVVLDGNEC